MEVIVVLPTYNEVENLPLMTTELLRLPIDLGILVVDDNSPDGTGEIAESLSREDSRISVLHKDNKEGLGAAYKSGFTWVLKNTDAQLIVQMDTDFSHDPKAVPSLVEAARNGAVAIGSRYIESGSASSLGLIRLLISKLGCFYIRTILELKIKDVTGGFKCWPRAVLESFDLSTIMSKEFFFQCEMNYLAQQNNFEMAEIPIFFNDRLYGASKMNWRIAAEAVWLVWHKKLFSKSRSYSDNSSMH